MKGFVLVTFAVVTLYLIEAASVQKRSLDLDIDLDTVRQTLEAAKAQIQSGLNETGVHLNNLADQAQGHFSNLANQVDDHLETLEEEAERLKGQVDGGLDQLGEETERLTAQTRSWFCQIAMISSLCEDNE